MDVKIHKFWNINCKLYTTPSNWGRQKENFTMIEQTSPFHSSLISATCIFYAFPIRLWWGFWSKKETGRKSKNIRWKPQRVFPPSDLGGIRAGKCLGYCWAALRSSTPAGWWWSGCRPVEELLVHDGADGAPTLKSDLLLLSSFTSYRQPGTQEHFSLDPSSHLLLIFCWSIHPLSIFSPVALRIFNGCKCALGTERLQSVP